MMIRARFISHFSFRGAAGFASSSAPLPPSQQPVQYKAPRQMTVEQVTKIGETDAAMRAAYDAVPESFSEHALAPGSGELAHLDVVRKRLIYRSKQRGWLEVDLLMGTFADAAVGSMNEAELRCYELILNRETLDLYNIVTGKDECPVELAGPVMDKIKAHVASSPLGRADPRFYEKMKKHFSN
jgi:succinate dehydrogenase assembly factor 2